MFYPKQKIPFLTTWLKYFLSYMLIFSVLILGSFFIIKNLLTDSYSKQSAETAELQLNHIASQIEEDLLYLSLLDSSLRTNSQLLEYRYQTDNPYRYTIHKELKNM